MIVRATVRNGRFVIEEPTDLPDGTEVVLDVVDEGLADMEPEDRAALLASIDRGIDEAKRGVPGIPAEQVLAELKAMR